MKLKLTNISSRRASPKKGKIVLEEMFHLLKRTDKWIVCEGVETKEMVDFSDRRRMRRAAGILLL
mgnify:CR=1 FL=1